MQAPLRAQDGVADGGADDGGADDGGADERDARAIGGKHGSVRSGSISASYPGLLEVSCWDSELAPSAAIADRSPQWFEGHNYIGHKHTGV